MNIEDYEEVPCDSISCSEGKKPLFGVCPICNGHGTILRKKLKPEEPAANWKPKEGEKYLYLTTPGSIERSRWGDYEFDRQARDFLGIQPDTDAGRAALEKHRLKIQSLNPRYSIPEPEDGTHVWIACTDGKFFKMEYRATAYRLYWLTNRVKLTESAAREWWGLFGKGWEK